MRVGGGAGNEGGGGAGNEGEREGLGRRVGGRGWKCGR